MMPPKQSKQGRKTRGPDNSQVTIVPPETETPEITDASQSRPPPTTQPTLDTNQASPPTYVTSQDSTETTPSSVAANTEETASRGDSITEEDVELLGSTKQNFREFTEAEEDELVGWIRDHPVLYDKSQRKYKDTRLKNKLFSDKAKEMGVDAVQIKDWLRNKRTHYTRLTKTPSGQGDVVLTDRQKWVVKSFAFLKRHVQVRGGSVQLGCSVATTSSERCTADTQSEEEEDVEQGEMVADTLPPADDTVSDEEERPAMPIKSPKPSFKKRKKNNLDEVMMNMCQRLSAKTPTIQTPAEKRRISYCNYLASEVILMSDAQFLRFVNSTNMLLYNMAQERLPHAPQTSTPTSSFQPPGTFAQSNFHTPATYSHPHAGASFQSLTQNTPQPQPPQQHAQPDPQQQPVNAGMWSSDIPPLPTSLSMGQSSSFPNRP